MNIEQTINQAALQVTRELYGQDVSEKMVQLQKTRAGFEGHLTLVVFPFTKLSHKRPEETAQEIGEKLQQQCEAVASFNVVKGFLNLVIAPQAWVALLNGIHSDEHYGFKKAGEDAPLVMIEYSSPNTNKPLHLGHVRNNLLGWSLSKIMEANFYVAFDKHYREECKALAEQYKAEGMKEEEAEEKAKQEAPLIKEAHQMLVKWEQGDPEVRALWTKMNAWVYAGFDETYKALGVSFDKIYYESNTYLEGKRKVEEGLEKGLFFRKEDGSVWADLTDEGLDQKLLLRADGTSVYMTQDIGTAEMRFNDFPIDKMIYVVGNEQNYHFQVLSLKYFILKVDARKNMMFNPAESIDFNGNTGPFIQYTYARIRSIMRKAQDAGLTLPDALSTDIALNEKETELVQKMSEFGAAVADAGQNYNPAGIANYCYELTKLFNQFYHDYSILNADTDEEKIKRVVLARAVGQVIKNGMSLLGIEVPERM